MCNCVLHSPYVNEVRWMVGEKGKGRRGPEVSEHFLPTVPAFLDEQVIESESSLPALELRGMDSKSSLPGALAAHTLTSSSHIISLLARCPCMGRGFARLRLFDNV